MRNRIINIVLAGAGGIGRELLAQIEAMKWHVQDLYGRDWQLRLAGVGDPRFGMAFARGGFSASGIDAGMTGTDFQLPVLVNGTIEMQEAYPAEHVVFVDCTAAEEVALRFADLLRAGVCVVGPSKTALSTPSIRSAMRQAALVGDTRWGFRCSVGADSGILPWISRARLAGDTMLGTDGVMNGTLNAVCTLTQPGPEQMSYSAAFRYTHAQGWTEPDPRKDGKGGDPGSKGTIVAWYSGYGDLPAQVECLVPKCALALPDDAPVEEILSAFGDMDEEWAHRVHEADRQGCRLRYLVSVTPESVIAQVVPVEPNHPAYSLLGALNVFEVSTEFHHPDKVVKRSRGAGRKNTANGVLRDILEVCGFAA